MTASKTDKAGALRMGLVRTGRIRQLPPTFDPTLKPYLNPGTITARQPFRLWEVTGGRYALTINVYGASVPGTGTGRDYYVGTPAELERVMKGYLATVGIARVGIRPWDLTRADFVPVGSAPTAGPGPTTAGSNVDASDDRGATGAATAAKIGGGVLLLVAAAVLALIALGRGA